MRRYTYLLIIPVIILFLGIALANMHDNESRTETPASTPTIPTDKAAEVRFPAIADRGKLLYENHCTECHVQYIHSRSSDKVNSTKDIRQWVIRWSRFLQLDWEDSDIKAVTDYLNLRYYNYTSEE